MVLRFENDIIIVLVSVVASVVRVRAPIGESWVRLLFGEFVCTCLAYCYVSHTADQRLNSLKDEHMYLS